MTPLPEQKHTDDELSDLRMRNAFAVRPPVEQVKSLALHPVFLMIIYVATFTAAGLALGKMYLPALISSTAVLFVGILIFWKKPRSRHHMTIIGIISLLVLVFGTVYYLDQLEPTNYDAQRPIGY